MKKEIFIILIVIALMGLVSAAYECSGNVMENSKEIGEGDKKNVNGLGIGVVNADEATAIGRISSELLVNAEKVSLSENSSVIFEISETTYSFNLTNLSESKAEISIDSSSKEIEEGASESFGGFQVTFTSSSGTTANFLIGKERIFLSNDNLEAVVEIDDRYYLVSLFSASDSDANIKVSICEDGEWNKVDDKPEIDESNANESIVNESVNESVEGLANISEMNITSNLTYEVKDNKEEPSNLYYYVLGGIVLVIFVVLFFLIRSFNKRGTYKELTDSGHY